MLRTGMPYNELAGWYYCNNKKNPETKEIEFLAKKGYIIEPPTFDLIAVPGHNDKKMPCKHMLIQIPYQTVLPGKEDEQAVPFGRRVMRRIHKGISQLDQAVLDGDLSPVVIGYLCNTFPSS